MRLIMMMIATVLSFDTLFKRAEESIANYKSDPSRWNAMRLGVDLSLVNASLERFKIDNPTLEERMKVGDYLNEMVGRANQEKLGLTEEEYQAFKDSVRGLSPEECKKKSDELLLSKGFLKKEDVSPQNNNIESQPE